MAEMLASRDKVTPRREGKEPEEKDAEDPETPQGVTGANANPRTTSPPSPRQFGTPRRRGESESAATQRRAREKAEARAKEAEERESELRTELESLRRRVACDTELRKEVESLQRKVAHLEGKPGGADASRTEGRSAVTKPAATERGGHGGGGELPGHPAAEGFADFMASTTGCIAAQEAAQRTAAEGGSHTAQVLRAGEATSRGEEGGSDGARGRVRDPAKAPPPPGRPAETLGRGAVRDDSGSSQRMAEQLTRARRLAALRAQIAQEERDEAIERREPGPWVWPEPYGPGVGAAAEKAAGAGADFLDLSLPGPRGPPRDPVCHPPRLEHRSEPATARRRQLFGLEQDGGGGAAPTVGRHPSDRLPTIPPRASGGGGGGGELLRWVSPSRRSPASLTYPTSRVGADSPDLSVLPPGYEVGPSPEEIMATAAREQAEAAKIQASVSAAMFEAKLPMTSDPKYTKVPEATHPMHIVARYILGGAGAHPCPANPEGWLSDGHLQKLAADLRDPYEAERKYEFGHSLSVSLVVNTVRCSFGSLVPEHFLRRSQKELLSDPVVLASPMKMLAPPKPVLDPEVLHGCGARAARWFSFTSHRVVGECFNALNESAYSLWEEDPSFTPEDQRAVLEEGFRRLEQSIGGEFARLETMAKKLGCTVIAPGPQGLQKLRDIALTPDKVTGESFLRAPWAILRPETPGGVLQAYEAKRQERIRLAQLELAGAHMRAQPEARGRGLDDQGATAGGSGGGSSWMGPVTQFERRRGDQLAPVDVASGLTVCLKCLSRDGCKGCTRKHLPPTTPLPLEVQLTLVDHGGWVGAAAIAAVDAPAARGALRRAILAHVASVKKGDKGVWYNHRTNCPEVVTVVRVYAEAQNPSFTVHVPSRGGPVDILPHRLSLDPAALKSAEAAAAPRSEARAGGSGGMRPDKGPPPAVAEAGTGHSDHVKEQDLAAEVKDGPGVKPALISTTVPKPVRTFASPTPDTEEMALTRSVAATLEAAFPDLLDAADNHRALVYAVASRRVTEGVPLADTGGLLAAGLAALGRSTLPGATDAAKTLRPPSSTAAGSLGQLTASRARDAQGRPLFVAYPRTPPGVVPQGASFTLCGENFFGQDLGDEIKGTQLGDLRNQCVIKVLAKATDTDPCELWTALHNDVVTAVRHLGPPGAWVSSLALQLRRLHHDFVTGGSHDLFLTRFLLGNLFATYRIVLICAGESGGQVSVQVIQSAHFDGAAAGARTRLICAHAGHAWHCLFPKRYTNGALGGELGEAGFLAAINRFENFGVPVKFFTHVTAADILSATADIPTEALEACACCGHRLYFANQYAGRLPEEVVRRADTLLDSLTARTGQTPKEAALVPRGLGPGPHGKPGLASRVSLESKVTPGGIECDAFDPSLFLGDASLDNVDVQTLLEADGAATEVAGPAPARAEPSPPTPKQLPRPPPGLRTWVADLAEPTSIRGGRPIGPSLPAELRRWVAQNEVAGGLTQSSLDKVYQHRSEDVRGHVRSVEDTRAFPTAPDVKKLARDTLAAARVAFGLLDREAIQANDASALKLLGRGIKNVSARGDKLVATAGGVRAAAAAFRQALLLEEGNLPVNVEGLDKLEGLVGKSELETLKGLASFGAPTLQAAEPPATAFREPYPTAGAAAGDLGYTALKDAAAGRALLVTGGSRKDLEAAGATISSLGATPKKDASGAFSGKVRAITDLRPLNKFLLEHLELQRVLSRLSAPQAVCPRIQQLMRAVVVLALRYPGVDLAGGKSDLSEAFKLIHVLLADVPSFAWKLPTDALPELKGLEVYQLLMVLPFGWDKSPGWFGLLAWVLAQAHASLGPEEPHLNGGDSFAGGLPWVDDYVFLTPLLGQRAKIAYEAYVGVATAGASKLAINLEKDALDGYPRTVFHPWGYIMDLSRVAAEGPLAGLLIATPEKVKKLHSLLTAPGFQSLHRRRLTMKCLEEVVGLMVWLAQTNSLLKVLLPSFYAAMNSLDAEYVVPAGNAQSVAVVWGELEDAVALATQLCLDYGTFKASFTASVTKALSPPEQVALGVPRIFLQSDSTGTDALLDAEGNPVLGPDGKQIFTKGVFAVACFALGVWGVDLVAQYEKLLQEIVGLDRATHIVVGELLPIVAAAMEHRGEWRGYLITALCDNDAVVNALNKRGSSHPFVRYLCLLLARLESLYGFQVVAYYINTKRNLLADDISRLYLKLTAEELQAHVNKLHPGLKRIDYGALLDFLLDARHAAARSFAVFDDTDESAERQLAAGRQRQVWRRAAQWQEAAGGAAAPPAETPLKGGCIEIFGGVSTMAVAAARAGVECLGVVEAHLPSRALARSRLGAAGQTVEEYDDIFAEGLVTRCSAGVELLLVGPAPPAKGVGPDPLTVGLVQVVERLNPLVVCVELIPDGGLLGDCRAARVLIEALARAGYRNLAPLTGRGAERELPFELIDVGELGGGQQRHRAILHFEPTSWAGAAGPLAELRPVPGPPRTLRDALVSTEAIPGHAFLEGRFVPFLSSDDASRPALAGHIFTSDQSVGVGQGSEVELAPSHASAEPGVRWTVTRVLGGSLDEKELVLERKQRRKSGANDPPVLARRSDVTEHFGRRLPVWHPNGAGTTVRATSGDHRSGPCLVLESRGAEPRVRRLLTAELWKLQGLTREDLAEFRRLNPMTHAEGKSGASRRSELVAAGRATPTVLAEAVVARAAERVHTLQSRLRLAPSIGVEPRWETVEWLGADMGGCVRHANGAVGAAPPSVVIEYDPYLVGTVVPPNPPGLLPTTRVSGGPRADKGRTPAVAPGPGAGEGLRQAVSTVLASSVNENSQTTYDSSWKNHWAAWTVLRGIPLYLDGANPRADEEELLQFVAHKAMVALYAHGTIHVMIYAVRRKHLLARYPDPLSEALLVKVAMKGIWRLQGGPLRKIPCSMDMIRWIADRLDWENWDEFAVVLALVLMFVFLLRSREALRKDTDPDPKQCVRVLNVVFFREGTEVTGEAIQTADEVVLMQGASKTDPNGQGSVANAFEAPGNELCLLSLLKRAQRMNPKLFASPDSFLLTRSDGRVLHRDVVAKHLSEAAVAKGAPQGAASVISMRSGGASAMWDAGMSSEDIKRRGRWSSDCYQIYIWPGHDRGRDVASKMLGSTFSLMASLAAYRRHGK